MQARTSSCPIFHAMVTYSGYLLVNSYYANKDLFCALETVSSPMKALQKHSDVCSLSPTVVPSSAWSGFIPWGCGSILKEVAKAARSL